MSHYFTPALGQINFDSTRIDLTNDGIRVMAVMSNTTADTEEDAVFVGDLGTLDELDATGYSRQTLANKSVVRDDTNDQWDFRADPINFGNVSNDNSRQVVGHVYYKFVTNDADSPIIAFVNGSIYPFDPDGGAYTVTPPGTPPVHLRTRNAS
ncbi:MAG: hypothetical protein GY711_18960 [bacterium]|nr:hypothetical protein [bacterium]